MRWSIRYQLLIPLVLLIAVVVSLTAWTALAAADRARHQIESQMRDITRTVNEATFPLTKKVLEMMKGFSGADFLIDDGGHLRTTFDQPPDHLPTVTEDSDQWEQLTLEQHVIIGTTSYLCSGVRLKSRLPQENMPPKTLYLFYPESLWRDALWEAVWPSLLLGGCAALASIILTVAVGRRLGRRIHNLVRRTRLIAEGDFSPMPLPGGDDELRDLGRSINDMAQRLNQYQETVKQTERLRLLGQVGGGLAHQLRNGVTGARLAVQLHARECDSEVDSEPLHVALRQLALVELHLKRFLGMGKTEVLKREPCSLPALIADCVALVKPQCQHAHIELHWKSPTAGSKVFGDAAQLGHLFLNVVTNAIEAAGPGGTVEIRQVATETGRGLIEVFDSGPGPVVQVAERLFEPFVTGKREGVGLGLAVARQVAEAHGGSICWSRKEKRTCFTIELPLIVDGVRVARGEAS